MATKKKTDKKSVTELMEDLKNQPDGSTEIDLAPGAYFDLIKSKAEKIDTENIRQMYQNTLSMIKKYVITGQKSGAEKLYNFASICEKELLAYQYGVTQYIERDTIEEYITQIRDNCVCIIDLEAYEREIPDDIIDTLVNLKNADVFTKYYVLFTDYTGEVRSQVEQARRDKDPILFGAIKIGGQVSSRLYVVGSWVDEKCDLTLDKLVADFKDAGKTDVVQTLTEMYPTVESLRGAFNKSQDK